MKRTLRQVLADSHVAAITIALLLLWTLDAMFRALWEPLYRVGAFLVTAILIWDLPYLPTALTISDRLMCITAAYFLYTAVASLSAAWLMSRWVYGMGPLRTLIVWRTNLTRRKHA